MNNKRTASLLIRVIVSLVVLLGAAMPVRSASITYVLDQSHILPDGVGYLQVTVSDGLNGAIDFVVGAINPDLLEIAGTNFGIQAFAFNVGPDISVKVKARNVTNLPAGWSARDNFRMAGFGLFDIRLLTGSNNARSGTLTFSITGIDGDTLEDYIFASSGSASGGNQFFAAKVAGFKCLKGERKCLTNGFFGGSSEVPLPATAWLFLTGMAGVAMRARRRFRH
ncbi:MAG: hypothetical protein FJ197_05890 [Gammaproteobacteria bacterium]|nr:hypothetical protein [Gammaproteobacteria bacterium]